jgi:hypothetical protein
LEQFSFENDLSVTGCNEKQQKINVYQREYVVLRNKLTLHIEDKIASVTNWTLNFVSHTKMNFLLNDLSEKTGPGNF